jgi:hypothetical protein
LYEILAEAMAGDSSGKKWWKRLGVGGRKSAKTKTPDSSPQESVIASSADSAEGTKQRWAFLLLADML